MTSTAVILLNYRRPQNIGEIVRAAAEGLPDASIFVLDQAETDTLRQRTDVPWHLVWHLKARHNGRAGARVQLACRLPFEHYLAIDDDIFLKPDQIRMVMDGLARQPNRVHGVMGEYVRRGPDKLVIRSGLTGSGGRSVVNTVYAFTRAHAEGAVELARQIGFQDWSEVRYGDDVLLSSAGQRPPLCHPVGRIECCQSMAEEGVAVCAEPQFRAAREALMRRLIGIRRLHLVRT